MGQKILLSTVNIVIKKNFYWVQAYFLGSGIILLPKLFIFGFKIIFGLTLFIVQFFCFLWLIIIFFQFFFVSEVQFWCSKIYFGSKKVSMSKIFCWAQMFWSSNFWVEKFLSNTFLVKHFLGSENVGLQLKNFGLKKHFVSIIVWIKFSLETQFFRIQNYFWRKDISVCIILLLTSKHFIIILLCKLITSNSEPTQQLEMTSLQCTTCL